MHTTNITGTINTSTTEQKNERTSNQRIRQDHSGIGLGDGGKKWAITERQALEQIAKDAISGNQSGLTKSFSTLLAESRKFLDSGKAYDTLSIA